MDIPGNSDNPDKKEKITAIVERIVFHSDETGYTVARVKPGGRREMLTVVGKIASLKPGETGEFMGQWVNDRKYGRQFQVPGPSSVIWVTSPLKGFRRHMSVPPRASSGRKTRPKWSSYSGLGLGTHGACEFGWSLMSVTVFPSGDQRGTLEPLP